LSADLKTVVTPCQFGGNPDCSQCGCAASLGLAAIGHSRLLGTISAGALFNASIKIGRVVSAIRRKDSTAAGDRPPADSHAVDLEPEEEKVAGVR
jgi:hypothetical protein